MKRVKQPASLCPKETKSASQHLECSFITMFYLIYSIQTKKSECVKRVKLFEIS